MDGSWLIPLRAPLLGVGSSRLVETGSGQALAVRVSVWLDAEPHSFPGNHDAVWAGLDCFAELTIAGTAPDEYGLTGVFPPKLVSIVDAFQGMPLGFG